jgi:DNA polymerase III epsilon subunit-like protein
MKLFLDCEFTQLNKDTKLISLALVTETGDEFYVELTDTYAVEDCSEFVVQHVLPQLDTQTHGVTVIEAQQALKMFLDRFEGPLEICTDAPGWDWNFFCDLAYVNHKWPQHVLNCPTNLIELFQNLGSEIDIDFTLDELPHHALFDARILAEMTREILAQSVSREDC